MCKDADNHDSLVENFEQSKEERKRLEGLGYPQRVKSWAMLIATWTTVMVNRIATVIRLRPDGSEKVRLVVDMLRSGVNSLVTTGERVVLPRPGDLAVSVIDLWGMARLRAWDFAVEVLISDFTDAFLTLKLCQEEMGYFATRAYDGEWLVYSRVPFGLASAPLLWCRFTALVGRLTQAILKPNEGRLHTYVDDPAVAIAGSRKQRTQTAAMILLFWLALGLQTQAHKAQFGTKVEWIGVQFILNVESVAMGISKKRTLEMIEVADNLKNKKGMCKIDEVRSFAGLASWVSGIVPRLRPFTAHLWAAVHDSARETTKRSSTRQRPKDLLFVRRIEHAAKWISSFLHGERGGIVRVMKLSQRHAKAKYTIRTDASTTGIAGILFNERLEPIQYWADDITKEDLKRYGSKEGDPAFMAEWEMLALLVSLVVWKESIKATKAQVVAQLDSKAAMGAALKLASPRPLVNAIAAEISLVLEEAQAEVLEPEHFRGVLNVEADALSRLREGKTIPKRLENLKKRESPTRNDSFYKAWPTDWKNVSILHE